MSEFLGYWWNGRDLENEDNYINLDRAGKVSRFCINEIYKDF